MHTVGAKKPVRACDKCINVVDSLTLGVTVDEEKNTDADISFMNDHVDDGTGDLRAGLNEETDLAEDDRIAAGNAEPLSVCYTVTCRSAAWEGAMGCYSPNCIHKSFYAGGNSGKRRRFQLLALDIKLMLGNAPHAIDELFAYATKHSIEEDRWPSFLADALSNGIPSMQDGQGV